MQFDFFMQAMMPTSLASDVASRNLKLMGIVIGVVAR